MGKCRRAVLSVPNKIVRSNTRRVLARDLVIVVGGGGFMHSFINNQHILDTGTGFHTKKLSKYIKKIATRIHNISLDDKTFVLLLFFSDTLEGHFNFFTF